MKKYIIVLSFLIFITNSFAQNSDFRFGLEFTNGLSFVNSDNKKITDTKVGYGFNYGLIVDYYFGKNYGIGSGLQLSYLRFSRKNSPYSNDVAGDLTSIYAAANNLEVGQKEIYKYTYLDIPFTFKLRTNEIGYFRYFGEFGIVNSFRVRSRLSVEGSEIENMNLNKKVEPLNDVKSGLYNASLKVGGGFEYTFSDKTALLVELSFNNGFINVLKDGDDQRSVFRVVNLTTGIMF